MGFDLAIWWWSAAALVLGGVIKGALGVGLPLVSVPILSLWLPSGRAIGLLTVPVVWSNLVQARSGGLGFAGWRRFRGLIVTQLVVTVLTVRLTANLPARELNILIAGAVLLAVLLMSLPARFSVPASQERNWGLVVGAFAGLLGGASSLTGPIVISYFMALKLPREEFVRSISLVYLAGSIPLYAAMLIFGRINWTDVGLSLLAMVPVLLGMRIGQVVRQRLNEVLFRRFILVFLVAVAIMLLMKN